MELLIGTYAAAMAVGSLAFGYFSTAFVSNNFWDQIPPEGQNVLRQAGMHQ